MTRVGVGLANASSGSASVRVAVVPATVQVSSILERPRGSATRKRTSIAVPCVTFTPGAGLVPSNETVGASPPKRMRADGSSDIAVRSSTTPPTSSWSLKTTLAAPRASNAA